MSEHERLSIDATIENFGRLIDREVNGDDLPVDERQELVKQGLHLLRILLCDVNRIADAQERLATPDVEFYAADPDLKRRAVEALETMASPAPMASAEAIASPAPVTLSFAQPLTRADVERIRAAFSSADIVVTDPTR